MKRSVRCLMVLFLASLMPASCSSPNKGLSFKPMDQNLSLSGSNYTLTIDRDPFGFTVSSGSRVIFASIPCTSSSLVSATANYQVNGKAGCVVSASGYNPLTAASGTAAGGASIYLQGQGTGWITYTFTLLGTMIRIDITAQNGAVSGVGDSFSVQTAGRWYGQGELGNYLNPLTGAVQSGQQWFPLDTGSFTRCPLETADQNNITTPLWLTSNGAALFVDSYGPMCMSMGNGLFSITGTSNTFSYYILAGKDIPSTYQDWIATDFTHKKAWQPVPLPAPAMFDGPVWSTWAEYLYGIDQSTVLGFAQSITTLGFPHSILEIDDKWQANWGDTAFDPAKFPDPKSMVDQLHAQGFKVSLWVPPFVDNDSQNFNTATEKYFIQSKTGGPALISWWDTASLPKNKIAGVINFADPGAMAWWQGNLNSLVSDDGIDGFKFDAGEANWFPTDGLTTGYAAPNQYADVYMGIHSGVPAMEFRSGWFNQDQGQIVREYDKDSVWGINNGLQSVIPQMFAIELTGYPFVLPDMIGGNRYVSYPSSELYDRWVEMNAFMPLMQFSIVPWNSNLGGDPAQTVAIAKTYAGIHQSLSAYMISVATSSAQTGMPVVKPLFFDYPSDPNTYTIDDEFLLGDAYLVCPVVTQGAVSRDVYLPSGTWKDFFTGGTFTGPATLAGYPATIAVIPVFEKQ